MATLRLSPILGIEIVGSSWVEPAEGGRRVDNGEVASLLDPDAGRGPSTDWLEDMGFESRWWTAIPGGSRYPGASTTDELLTMAAAAALDDAGISGTEVDLLIAASTTPSRLTSSMATVTTGRLGLRCAALDIRSGCPSSLYGLANAYALLAAGAEVAVVTAAETLSALCPGGSPAFVVGDAAAAVVLTRSASSNCGLLGGFLDADGRWADRAGAGGSLPPNIGDLSTDNYRLRFDAELGAEAAIRWDDVSAIALTMAMSPDGTVFGGSDVSALVANQPNRPCLHATASNAGIPMSAVVDVVGRTANAGSASLLAALHEARCDDRAAPGRLVVASAVGGGLSWGGLVLRP